MEFWKIDLVSFSNRINQFLNFFKLQIGLYHCTSLVKVFKMHIQKIKFEVRMRKLHFWNDSAVETN